MSLWLFVPLLTGQTACDDEAFSPPTNEEKIDAPVVSAMQTGGSLPVIVLGEEQLLDMPDGFAVFTAAHAADERTVLRPPVIAQLKEIAAREQPGILGELDAPERARGLWVVNAIVAVLTPDEIDRVAALPSVKYVYAAEGGPPSEGAVGQATVVANGVRAPFTTDGKSVAWNLDSIGARRAWDELGVTGEGVVIGVLDGGVKYDHEDLQGAVWLNDDEIANNGIDDDDNGIIDDVHGFNFASWRAESYAPLNIGQHGTYVAGIIVGDGTGGTVTGVAPRASIMSLIGIPGTYSRALSLQYALENGADIVNMSFSIPGLGNARGFWRLLAEQATVAGLVQVSGAGNFRQTSSVPVQLRIPEAVPSVIAAGGVNQDLTPAEFSSMGPVEWASVVFYEDFPELIKPDVAGFPGPSYAILNPAGGYHDPNPSVRGNSFSGPQASGVAALVLSANPDIPAWEVKAILEMTARDITGVGKDNDTGHGLLDAFAAVQMALQP